MDDSVDTLGRWMAHHLAELINDSENAATSQARAKARKMAVDTILKIWKQRESLPRNVYPLARYAEVLQMLYLLRPDANPFMPRFRIQGIPEDVDRVAHDLFDDLVRLTIGLLMLKLPTDMLTAEIDPVAFQALNVEEQQTLIAMESWFELLPTIASETGTKKRSGHQGKQETSDPNSFALRMIDHIEEDIQRLRTALKPADVSIDQTSGSSMLRSKEPGVR